MVPKANRLLTAVGIHSIALIAFQLALMQILSIVQWYHFAYMVMSVALLGFGASGTLLALRRDWFLQRAAHAIPLLMIASGISMTAAAAASQVRYIRFDSYLLFVERSQIASVLLTYLVIFVPFFLGALALGLVFIQYASRIGSVYAANLAGSGAGGLIVIALLWIVFPQQLPAVVGLFPILAGALILPEPARRSVAILALAGVVLTAIVIAFPPSLHPSQYKSLSRTLDLPKAEIIFERNSPHGLLQVVSSPALRRAPGLSLNFADTVPSVKVVFNNGEWYGPLVPPQREEPHQLLRYSTAGLPYEMMHRKRVLVLQARAGTFVAQAIERGAEHVVAVEHHAALIDLLHEELANETDSLFMHRSVELIAQEPRSFLISDTSRYDLIVFPTLEMFGGSGGVYAIQEQYLLTKQAFGEAWNHLTPDGVLCITSWIDYPLRNQLRAHATIIEMLVDARIVNPTAHLAAVRSWGTITFVAKRTPLHNDEIARARNFCDAMLFDPALLPDITPSERNKNNILSDSTLFVLLDQITESSRHRIYRNYAFNIEPATDDRPYFSQFLSWKSVPDLGEIFGQHAVPFIELASFIIVLTLIQISVLAIAITIVPLVLTKKMGRERLFVISYFASIGSGYMFVEMILIQRFVLFLGQPIYAVASVIAAMLFFSGWGSGISSRLKSERTSLTRIISTNI